MQAQENFVRLLSSLHRLHCSRISHVLQLLFSSMGSDGPSIPCSPLRERGQEDISIRKSYSPISEALSLRVEKRAKSLGSRCVLGGQIHYTVLLQGRRDTLDLSVTSETFSGQHTPNNNILATLDSTSLLRRPCDRSLQMVTELN